MMPRLSMLVAPRNGLSIIVGHDDVGEFIMHWNPTGRNPLAQPGMGIWEAADRSFTWSEADGMGPSWWRPYNPPAFDAPASSQPPVGLLADGRSARESGAVQPDPNPSRKLVHEGRG